MIRGREHSANVYLSHCQSANMIDQGLGSDDKVIRSDPDLGIMVWHLWDPKSAKTADSSETKGMEPKTSKVPKRRINLPCGLACFGAFPISAPPVSDPSGGPRTSDRSAGWSIRGSMLNSEQQAAAAKRRSTRQKKSMGASGDLMHQTNYQ